MSKFELYSPCVVSGEPVFIAKASTMREINTVINQILRNVPKKTKVKFTLKTWFGNLAKLETQEF